jgi:hypothetical protein
MSGDYDNELKGVLFKNDEKSKDEDRDYSGTATIGGREFWLSGWKKRSKSGTPFLSLSFKPKDAVPAKPQPRKPAATYDDDIPF